MKTLIELSKDLVLHFHKVVRLLSDVSCQCDDILCIGLMTE